VEDQDADPPPAQDNSVEAAITSEGPTRTLGSTVDTQDHLRQDVGRPGQKTLLQAPACAVDSSSAAGEGGAADQPAPKLCEEDAIIAAVTAYGCQMWLRMSRWARINEFLEPRERSLAYSVGKRLREGVWPTIRQARWAQAIVAKAVQLGFDLTTAD
jgi:hypothetical protein